MDLTRKDVAIYLYALLIRPGRGGVRREVLRCLISNAR